MAMVPSSSFSSVTVGIAAGLMSAAAFASLLTGAGVALLLFLLSGLPVVVACLGWGTGAGLVANLIVIGAMSLGLRPEAAAPFVVLTGVPLVLVCHLIGLARPAADGVVEWYPLGRVLTVLAGAVAVGAVIVGWQIGFAEPRTLDVLAGMLTASLRFEGVADPAATADTIARAMIATMPLMMPLVWTLILIANLWLGAHLVRRAGRLARPWPDLAMTELPRGMAFAMIVLEALAFAYLGAGGIVGPGFGQTSAPLMPLAGAVAAVHIVIGLAVLHVLTRGNAARPALLAIAWGASLIFAFPALLLILTAIIDAFGHLRRRVAVKLTKS